MRLSDFDLDMIFHKARTAQAWMDRPVSEAQLREIYDLMRWGPTSANCNPARLLFLHTPEAKARLLPALDGGNREKVRSSPATVIIGYDLNFYDELPQLFPRADARSWFAGKQQLIETTAFRNSSLQGAYLIIAARALGLDCAPMSGFDNGKVDAEFFPQGNIRSNFICGVGYGDPARLLPRDPRLAFEQACRVL